MMSALECIQKAGACEEMARTVSDSADRQALLATAEQWRTLARVAEAESSHGRRADAPAE